MKRDLCASSNEPSNENLGRRKREQDAVRIDAAIKTALEELADDEERRAAFLRLLACVRTLTPLLKRTPGHGTPGWVAPVFLINRLKNLAARQSHWIRPCETWRSDGSNLRPAFRSLAHHLLTCYPVPCFMDSAWDLAAGPEAFRQQSWFIRLGRGTALRAMNLPLVLTRSMEHYVRQAPDHYTAAQALRYGETRGLGGSEELACEIAIGPLGQRIERADFWRTVLSFFVAHPQMKLEHVNPIVDFIHTNKFAGDEGLTEGGTEIRNPPWPDFSMKGRTLKSILRLVTAWHSDLEATKPGRRFSWRKTGIQGYRFLEKRPDGEPDREWAIQELVDSGALYSEGRAMRHCVYSYANRCWRGETTIWSLRLRIDGEEKRMTTIEVDPRRCSIIEARAKCNLRPGVRSLEIIRQWADWAGLQFDLRV
jgi:PcfJ-like protein